MSFPFSPFPSSVPAIFGTSGLFAGGYAGSGANFTSAEMLTFATDTMAAASGATVTTGKREANGESIPSKGFVFVGFTGSVHLNTADRYIFSTGTVSQVAGAALTIGNSQNFSSTNNSICISQRANLASKTTFSTETSVSSTAILGQSRYLNHQNGGGKKDKAFLTGGFTGTVHTNTTDRLTYATESSAIVAGAALSAIRSYVTVTHDLLSSYSMGGYASASVQYATVQKIPFATETISTPAGAQLPQTRWSGASSGNAKKGYWTGGATTAVINDSRLLTFATDTLTAVASANHITARYFHTGI